MSNTESPEVKAAPATAPAQAPKAAKPVKASKVKTAATAPAKKASAPKAVKPAKAAVLAAKPPAAKPPATKKASVRKAPAKTASAATASAATKDKDAGKAKQKLVRDSFTMPRSDFALIDTLKERALGFRRATKKSELLRAGLQALSALSDAQLQQVLGRLVPLKTGRPKKGE